MAKPRMIGMNKTFIPNSKADQMKKRFNRNDAKKQWNNTQKTSCLFQRVC